MRGYQGPKYAFQIRETLKSILSILKRRQNDVDPFAESGPVLLNWLRHNASNGSDNVCIVNVIACFCKISDKFIIDVLSLFSICLENSIFDGITATLTPIMT